MTLAAAVLAAIMFWVDQRVPFALLQGKWYIFHPQSVAEARAMLSNIGSTSLGVIGVVFSITLVPLSITATQYGSIVLRGFLRDRGTQIVLGAYTATTFYCLVLLLALGQAGAQTVDISATIAFYMLLTSLLLLVYFFHHVADSLQASAVAEQVSKELQQIINQDYPFGRAQAPVNDQRVEELVRQATLGEGEVVTSSGEGYLRAIDYDYLTRLASERKLTLRLQILPGDFVSRGDPLLIAWPRRLDERAGSLIKRAYMFGRNRTLFQDTEYGIYLLVIIAVRALSPAINDPYTPTLCLNRIGAALGMLVKRPTPSPYHFDKDNQLRLIRSPASFERLAGVAFDMIREYGRGNAEVLIKMLETIRAIASHTHSDKQRKVLLKHAALIEQDAHIGLPSEYDQQRVHDSYEETVRAIGYEPTNHSAR